MLMKTFYQENENKPETVRTRGQDIIGTQKNRSAKLIKTETKK